MYADPKKVRARRIKRRLKAGASILLATAAGAFIACQRIAGGVAAPPGPSPMGPDARPGPAPADSASSVDIPPVASGQAEELDAAPPPRAKQVDAAVDVNEHRKGMPVRDNLLE